MYERGGPKLICMFLLPLTARVEDAIRHALTNSWSERTNPVFDPVTAPRSYCQCAQTAIVVFERFGGDILRTRVLTLDGEAIEHFYNRIAGRRYDFTGDQFDMPNYWQTLKYQDIASSFSEAVATLQPSQLDAMRSAFTKQYEASNAD
jgi:hypothetical protein